ncbi:MAG: hypothetical protein DRQ55_16960 [Planctomycetota bacterium]|nr:MAG: hypothetical protein DRQ55_16960 [Planctomycetota bacterium]
MSNSEIPPGVEIEKVFLVEAQYTPDAAERRPAVRAEHLARVVELRRAGTIIEGGAYSDAMTSSILIVRADDAAAALAIARADVYVKSGVWGDISARPFGRVTSGD